MSRPAAADRPGLLLFAHGARDPEWARPFEQVAHQARMLAAGAEVRLAFLEFMTPTMDEAAAELAAAQCTVVHVVPLFLGSGGHVRRDIPKLLQHLQARYSTLEFMLHPAVGEMTTVINAMAQIAASFMQQQAPTSAPTP